MRINPIRFAGLARSPQKGGAFGGQLDIEESFLDFLHDREFYLDNLTCQVKLSEPELRGFAPIAKRSGAKYIAQEFPFKKILDVSPLFPGSAWECVFQEALPLRFQGVLSDQRLYSVRLR